MLIVLILLYIQPLNPSLLSRVKNRYEYLPHEDTNLTTEELYDFPISKEEVFIAERPTINIISTKNEVYKFVSKKYRLNATEVSLNKYPNTTIDVRYNKALNTMQPFVFWPSSSEIIVDMNATEMDRIDIYLKSSIAKDDNLSHDLSMGSLTSLQWRPTKYFNDTTWKFRKTFASLFPTKGSTSIVTGTITRRKNKKSKVIPWIFKVYKQPVRPNSNLRTMTPASTRKQIENDTKAFFRQSATSCYMCGTFKSGIPRNAECYQIFESPDQRYRWKRKHYRVKCVKHKEYYWKSRYIYGPWFRGGCYKRYLDVGTIYNERGCRLKTNWQWSGSYATKRFRKLEKLLNHVDEGCVSSPYASLTPFSRAVSLYARYHVCVCKKKYCNSGTRLSSFLCFILVLINV